MAYWLIEEKGASRPLEPAEENWNEGYCSNCGEDCLYNFSETGVFSHYCPNCGEEMENWQSDEQYDANEQRYAAEAKKAREEWLASMTPEKRAEYDAWMDLMRRFGPIGTTGPVDPAEYEAGEA